MSPHSVCYATTLCLRTRLIAALAASAMVTASDIEKALKQRLEASTVVIAHSAIYCTSTTLALAPCMHAHADPRN